MKKKRFLRLVMAYGIQRNEATQIAARVGKFGSYNALFTAYRPLLIGRAFAAGFEMGLRKVSAAAVSAARGMADLIASAFGGVDFAAGEDQSIVVHHVQSDSGAPLPQTMTQEEHEAAHAAGRSG